MSCCAIAAALTLPYINVDVKLCFHQGALLCSCPLQRLSLSCFYQRKTSWTPSSHFLDRWKTSNCVCMLLMRLTLTLSRGGTTDQRGVCVYLLMRLILGSSGSTLHRRALHRQHHDRPPGPDIRSVRIVSAVTVELLFDADRLFPLQVR